MQFFYFSSDVTRQGQSVTMQQTEKKKTYIPC